MPVIREWLRRLWGTFRKAPEDAVMQEELRLHLDMLAADLRRRGLPPEEALRQARLQAGGVAPVMDQRRDQRGLPWLEDLFQDARFGARMLRRAPVVTSVALLMLTLAIGANTAIFSLVDPLLFRDVPVRDPTSLVQFTYQYPRDPPLNMFGLTNYEQYRDGNHVFSDLFGLAPLTTESRSGDDPIAAEVVTGNFFKALGVRPALGRVLDVSDDKPGATATAVVSWQVLEESIQWRPAGPRLCHRHQRHARARAHAGHGSRRRRTRIFRSRRRLPAGRLDVTLRGAGRDAVPGGAGTRCAAQAGRVDRTGAG